jgi:hypothetical protein
MMTTMIMMGYDGLVLGRAMGGTAMDDMAQPRDGEKGVRAFHQHHGLARLYRGSSLPLSLQCPSPLPSACGPSYDAGETLHAVKRARMLTRPASAVINSEYT